MAVSEQLAVEELLKKKESFGRFVYNTILYCTANYTRAEKRYNSSIQFNNDNLVR